MNNLQKTVFFAVIALVFTAGLVYYLPGEAMGDERVYAASAAYLDVNINVNPEHPLLVKSVFSLLLPTDEKARVRSEVPPSQPLLLQMKETPPHLLQAIKDLRFRNAILLIALTLAFFWGDYTALAVVFSVLFLTGAYFSATLDSWVTLIAAAAVNYGLKQKPAGEYLLAYIMLPLTKIYGFAFSLVALIINPELEEVKLLTLVAVLVCIFPLDNFLYGLAYFTPQVQGSVAGAAAFNVRYFWPAFGIAGVVAANQVRRKK